MPSKRRCPKGKTLIKRGGHYVCAAKCKPGQRRYKTGNRTCYTPKSRSRSRKRSTRRRVKRKASSAYKKCRNGRKSFFRKKKNGKGKTLVSCPKRGRARKPYGSSKRKRKGSKKSKPTIKDAIRGKTAGSKVKVGRRVYYVTKPGHYTRASSKLGRRLSKMKTAEQRRASMK